jgi:hypothetical protein
MYEIEVLNNEKKEGFCDLKKDNCVSKEKGLVISVFDSKREIFVCENCLNIKIKQNQWKIKDNN